MQPSFLDNPNAFIDAQRGTSYEASPFGELFPAEEVIPMAELRWFVSRDDNNKEQIVGITLEQRVRTRRYGMGDYKYEWRAVPQFDPHRLKQRN
jgi:hypothetical protein